eukprot:TRINITY_DN69706_c0_g1_i1.p1 TRINITY_DN69706_c0_g1~~TRINITY_DN69706_c0_g1_i1.p1  ORF type:complete len:350 (+),score=36.15 TRINITY_DN69706_c0_g1_i1:54-1052(+)
MVLIIDCSGMSVSAAAGEAKEAMEKHGAVVIRGANGSSAQTFSEFASSFKALWPQFKEPPLMWDSGYRHSLAPGIVNASSDVPELSITPHCEHQDCPRSPVYILFACAKPAEHGGQTPIYNVQKVEQHIAAQPTGRKFLADLRKSGVRVSRFYPGVDDPRAAPIIATGYPRFLDKFPSLDDEATWDVITSSFRRHEAKHFIEQSTQSMRLEWWTPGFAKHPIHGDDVFYYGYGTHGSYFDEFMPEVPYRDRSFHNVLGCGREVTAEELDLMREAWASNAERFQWKTGDVLCLDNFRFAHGRDPFRGQRKVMASFGNAVHWAAESGPKISSSL